MSGGPAANSQTGGPEPGRKRSDEHTVPKPPTGATLICAARGPDRSARIARQVSLSAGSGGRAARNRGRWRATRGLAGSSGSCAVTMWTPGDKRRSCGRPCPSPRTKTAPSRSASTMLKVRVLSGIQFRHGRARRLGAWRCESHQRQLSPASLAGRGAEAPGAVEHGSDHPMPVHAHPGPAPGAVPSCHDAGPLRPVSSRGVPGPVQHLVAVGGEDERPGMSGTDQQDDGAHAPALAWRSARS